jgi:hypothetical protein
MWGSFSRGSREIPSLARSRMRSGPRRESPGSTTPMNGHGKSDRSIVPKKLANKAGVRKPAAELMEERERAEGNPCGQTSLRTQCRKRLQHAFAGVRVAVKTAWPLLPEAGAQCVNRARWDLCGGRRATGGPTATGTDNLSCATGSPGDRVGMRMRRVGVRNLLGWVSETWLLQIENRGVVRWAKLLETGAPDPVASKQTTHDQKALLWACVERGKSG